MIFKKRKKKKISSLIKKTIFSIFIFKIFHKIKDKNKNIDFNDNFVKFLHCEKREWKRLIHKKQTLKGFLKDSFGIIGEYFLPLHCNDFKPKILRRKSLFLIMAMVIALKIFTIAYVFLATSQKAYMSSDTTEEIFLLINKEREKNNLEPLIKNKYLQYSAEQKAKDMIKNNYFSHYGPDGKKPWDWINRDNYPYIYAGENLAMNFNTAEAAHIALMRSPTHKKNILNRKYKDIGLAVIKGKIDNKETNILVEFFASKNKETNKVNLASIKEENQNKKEKKKEPVLEPEKTTAQKTNNELNIIGVIDEKIKEVNGRVKLNKEKKENIEIKERVKKTNKNNIVAVKNNQKQEKIKTYAEINSIIEKNKASIQKEFDKIEKEKNNFFASQEKFSNVALSRGDLLKKASTQASPFFVTKIDANTLNNEIKSISVKQKQDFLSIFLRDVKYIYFSILMIMIMTLISNILIRVNIQHKSVIVETLILILFISSLFTIHIKLMENVLENVLIL